MFSRRLHHMDIGSVNTLRNDPCRLQTNLSVVAHQTLHIAHEFANTFTHNNEIFCRCQLVENLCSGFCHTASRC